jgi:Xaa-Pro aminopeptidase
VAEQGLSGAVLFDQHSIRYFANLGFLATERPVAFVANTAGDLAVYVPEFEVERVRAETDYERVESYPEYPGIEHPMVILARLLADMGMRGPIGADNDGYPGILGYEGPALSEATGRTVVSLAPKIEHMIARKSEAEVELIRQSARWCEHAHRLLQEYTRPGATEAAVSLRIAYEATLAMIDALGSSYGGQLASSDGVSAGYRGQIGRRSAWAHAIAHNIEFAVGDVLVSETSAPVWGYNAELERAMVIGEPTDEMRRLFDHTVAAQDVAFAALRPGVACADVDRAVLGYFEENDLMPYWRQHGGHAIGLRDHEAPFLDVGDETVVERGRCSRSGGLYDAQIGGFRRSTRSS